VSARRSERFASRERRELRREVLISPYPELGLVAMDGPNDPEPGLELEDGRVVAMDGRRAEDFDIIDRFVARYGVDLDVAAEAALLAEWKISQPDVPARSERAFSDNARKAWRFVGEMEEDARALADAGLPAGFHEAAADIYQRLAAYKDMATPPAVAEALAELLKRRRG